MKRTTLILAAAVLAAACSDSTGLETEAGVSLSFTAGAGPAAASGVLFSMASDTLSDGQSNELILTSVEVVLREIELKRQSAPACDDLPDNDDCEKFEVGPVLLDVPLNGETETLVTIMPDPDTYDEIEFEIHKVSNDDPEDAAFRSAHPDMVGKSIRVQGSYNGQPFTYETDLNVEQEFDLSPPVVVTAETTSTNVTVLLGVDSWFRDGSGNLVNPQDGNKGGQHESLVKENIKQSIEAFEDHDSDGEPDVS